MSESQVEDLPAYVALEALPVLRGVKSGASVQLDSTYFSVRLSALDKINREGRVDDRIEALRESYNLINSAEASVGSFDESELWNAALNIMDTYRESPEVKWLTQLYPGSSFVVPEFVRGDGYLDYGARVYFLKDDETEESDVLEANIQAVVENDRESFERYQGRLHGYPDCCIEYFHDRTRESPEKKSVNQLESYVNETENGVDIRDGILDEDMAYGFFSKEFFPEPDCDTAQELGKKVYESLSSEIPRELVNDYFRMNYRYGREVAKLVETKGKRRPGLKDVRNGFGKMYLPYNIVARLPSYK
ncbi:MAG: hypothetical protein ABEK59_02020 [Halobacteria archaeon]